MPDFFPVVHAIIKRYSLAMGQRVRQAHRELHQAQAALARRQERPQAEHADAAATAVVEASKRLPSVISCRLGTTP